jgi:hypothetical protein
MIIKTTNDINIEVYFDPSDREEGYLDDIAFVLTEEGPKDARLFPSGETRFLLTSKEAERLANALTQAAEASRKKPR